ncbi:BrnA antitoxin family protein [uncultured Selenomonas sp.]|uniref:BrnA antitoxin family protein n=1 Tax=uncultured Selenomonas sp. TaxID=159275 RepID=UPI0025FBCA0D|nr:BrnA antitoxin family protein [uncultured Selenomonas sp.]
MAIHRMYVKPGQKPTEEQLERIRKAASFPITYDEDCPELTDEQYAEFASIAEKQREARKKQIVSLRLSPDTLRKAKKLGRGYTGVLSRLLDLAINDPQMVARCL